MNIAKTLKMALKKVLSLQFGSVDTDNGRLIWDGEGELEAGMEVFVEVEGEDEPKAAPDGEYKTEDGKNIIVVDGKVSEIQDPEAEVAPEAEAEVEAEIEVPEAEAEPADEPEAEPEASEEDRLAAIEEKIANIIEGINGIVNAIASIEDRLAEVEGKLAKVEEPAADPIDEAPVEEEMKKTRLSYMRKN